MSETAASASASRKRLGQFFSGPPVARLLAAVARAEDCVTAVDPFLGSGDMLAACLELNPEMQVSGIEVDRQAWQQACGRLTEPARAGALVAGNAFSPDALSRLPNTSADLVITNPPYVRYQAQALSSNDGLPSALEVRTGLLQALQEVRLFPHLSPLERDLLCELARGYSGLADLAVPAWLLSAAMTKPGGALVMVVPEAWLSRDYARVVQCVLLRLFRLRHVVEDAHACWFRDATVRTTLVVAERVVARPSCAGWGDTAFLKTDVEARAQANGSLVAGGWPGQTQPERLFADALGEAANGTGPLSGTGWRAHSHRLETMARELVAGARGQAWAEIGLGALPVRTGGAGAVDVPLPEPLARWLGPETGTRFGTLQDAGFEVGQGLRTGANDFFHVTLVDEGEPLSRVRTRDGALVLVPSSCLLPVVCNQRDLDGSSLSRAESTDRLLWLEGWAIPEDVESMAQATLPGTLPIQTLPACLSAWIRTQERAGVSQMSAVRTNARSRGKGAPRWWYTLPPLAPRHRADLLLPRVNGSLPLPILNPSRRLVVDANFSTIWTDTHPARVPGLLALLGTAWCGAALEHLASVMGGGALKVEATHLSRLPLPSLDERAWAALARLGARLVAGGWTEAVLDEADALLVRALVGDTDTEGRIQSLRTIRDERIRRRCHKTRKGERSPPT